MVCIYMVDFASQKSKYSLDVVTEAMHSLMMNLILFLLLYLALSGNVCVSSAIVLLHTLSIAYCAWQSV